MQADLIAFLSQQAHKHQQQQKQQQQQDATNTPGAPFAASDAATLAAAAAVLLPLNNCGQLNLQPVTNMDLSKYLYPSVKSQLPTTTSTALASLTTQVQQQQQLHLSPTAAASPGSPSVNVSVNGNNNNKVESNGIDLSLKANSSSASTSSSASSSNGGILLDAPRERLEKVLLAYTETAKRTLSGPDYIYPHIFPHTPLMPAEAVPLELKTKPRANNNNMPVKRNSEQQAAEPADLRLPPNKRESYKAFDPLMAPPPFPIQQPPVLTPSDQSATERSVTLLEGEEISCFTVGGEKRLCLPQILNIVLNPFSLEQVYRVVKAENLFISTCNKEQIDVFKRHGDIPDTTPSCGLLTKTDAHRLCSALFQGTKATPDAAATADFKGLPTVKVYHECFGLVVGLYAPTLYLSEQSECIQCLTCFEVFSPTEFVCHSHENDTETLTVHWGFDPDNWRSYIQPVEDNYDLHPKQPMPLCCGGRLAYKQLGIDLEHINPQLNHTYQLIKNMKKKFLPAAKKADSLSNNNNGKNGSSSSSTILANGLKRKATSEVGGTSFFLSFSSYFLSRRVRVCLSISLSVCLCAKVVSTTTGSSVCVCVCDDYSILSWNVRKSVLGWWARHSEVVVLMVAGPTYLP